jgi:hypothetical protein
MDVQHFFVARLTKLDEAARSGPEFDDPSRGGYDLDRVGLREGDLMSMDLRPPALKDFIVANRDALVGGGRHRRLIGRSSAPVQAHSGRVAAQPS